MTTIAVIIRDEMEDETLYDASGKLDLETGWITEVAYKNLPKHISKPSEEKDYAFTYCIMPLGTKELEFAVEMDSKGQFKVERDQLAEIKEKAAKLLTKKNKIK